MDGFPLLSAHLCVKNEAPYHPPMLRSGDPLLPALGYGQACHKLLERCSQCLALLSLRCFMLQAKTAVRMIVGNIVSLIATKTWIMSS